jgi:hypothetical protein
VVVVMEESRVVVEDVTDWVGGGRRDGLGWW